MPIDWGRPVSDSPLNRGLLHWWTGLRNNANAVTLEDIMLFSPATLTNGPLWDNDVYNQPIINYDGTNDYSTAGDVNDTEGVTAMSVMVWCMSNTLSGGTSNLRYLVSRENGGGAIWILRQLSGGDKLQWFVNDGALSAAQEVTGHTAFEWECVVATYKASVGLDIYRNGVSSSSTGSTSIGTMTTGTQPLEIGGAAFSTGRAWSGPVHSVKIFDYRLSQSDAWEQFVECVTGFPTTFNRFKGATFFFPVYGVLPLSCANVILVDDAASGNNPYQLETALEAGAELAGDLESEPPVPAVYSTANEILVQVSMLEVANGSLLGCHNVVLVVDEEDSTAQYSCSNEVVVGQNGETSVGNQLVAGLYRR